MHDRHVRVHIVRHGVTPWNEEGRIVGYEDLDLSEKGVMQAEGARDLLAESRLDLALVSPLRRTRRTAEIVLSAHQLELELEQRLIELKLKGWEGRRRRDLQGDPSWQAWITTPDEVATPEGERLIDVRRRAMTVLRETVAELPQGAGLLLATHGGVARVLMLSILGMPLSAYHKVKCDCGSVSVFDVDSSGELIQVLALNVTKPFRAF